MRINKNQLNDVSQSEWEKILKKNSFQGCHVNRLANAVSRQSSDTLLYDTQKHTLSFENEKINLHRITNRNKTWTFSRLKHCFKLKLNSKYKKQYNQDIKHLATLINEKLQAEPNQKKSTYIFRGTQAGCQGSVTIRKVEKIRARLDDEAAVGITFNPSKVIDSVTGGICSAMSLEFVDSYFLTKSTCKEEPDYCPSLLLDKIKLNKKAFAKSSQSLKDLQAAFNTIEVIPDETPIDYSKNKVQSLANFYSLEITHASSELDTTLSNVEELDQEINDLLEGVYLIRIIKAEDNDKLETCGHSTVFIKEEGICLFYDPNFGVQNLSEKDSAIALHSNFRLCFDNFKISKARFYRLQPKE